MPKVSIITPCYNSEEFLGKTYEAVTHQTFQDWEWILVDDCSIDQSFQIISHFAEQDKRIRVVKNQKNSGAAFSRNEAINIAQGEYIAFLDADDLWMSDKLEKQVAFMDKIKCDFSYHNFDMIESDGRYIKTEKGPAVVTRSFLEKFNPLHTSSVMMKKSAVGSIRFKVELRRRQDYVFWHQVVSQTKQAFNVGEVLSSYRVGNSTSLSHNKIKLIPIQWKMYREEFQMGFISSVYSISAYAVHGIRKYFL